MYLEAYHSVYDRNEKKKLAQVSKYKNYNVHVNYVIQWLYMYNMSQCSLDN